MRNRSKRFVASISSLMLLPVFLLGAAASTASASGPGSEEVEPRPSDNSDLGDYNWFWPGRSCTFYARADLPHRSGNDSSGHGAWVNTANPASNCPNRAVVTVELQAWECVSTDPFRCEWRTKKWKTLTRYSRQQVAVHYPCRTRETASWRTKVTVKVKIPNWFDKWDTDTRDNAFDCRV